MRYNVNLLNNLYFKYKHLINFISIYIQEAHADNEWPIRTDKQLKINQHCDIDDRIKASKLLIDKYEWKIPLYIDSYPDNEFSTIYNGWPMRVILINNQDMTIDYVAQQIKPYQGFLQFQLFRDLEKMIEMKLNIQKNSAQLCDDLIAFTENYKF